jgi:hypothetical protein
VELSIQVQLVLNKSRQVRTQYLRFMRGGLRRTVVPDDRIFTQGYADSHDLVQVSLILDKACDVARVPFEQCPLDAAESMMSMMGDRESESSKDPGM